MEFLLDEIPKLIDIPCVTAGNVLSGAPAHAHLLDILHILLILPRSPSHVLAPFLPLPHTWQIS